MNWIDHLYKLIETYKPNDSYANWFSVFATLITLFVLIIQHIREAKKYKELRQDNFLTIPFIDKISVKVLTETKNLRIKFINRDIKMPLNVQILDIQINKTNLRQTDYDSDSLNFVGKEQNSFGVFYNINIESSYYTEIQIYNLDFKTTEINMTHSGKIIFQDIFKRKHSISFTFKIDKMKTGGYCIQNNNVETQTVSLHTI